MSDTSGAPLVPPRDARLSPEAIADRGFSQVKRGYSESEVRAYLRMVADELAAVSGRERDLANRIRSLEARLSAPKPAPSDHDLIAALGEETARVLGQARESAAELRTKAEEHARRVVREAQESAREFRNTTQKTVETRTREAEEAARARAKEIVSEARSVRERVLVDLNERRQELERQITDLRAGRGRLVETYQVVERALVQATRLMADEPAPPGSSAAHVVVGEPRAAVVVQEAPAPNAPEPDVQVAEAAAAADESQRGADSDTRDVGKLFEKLRSEQPEPETAPAGEPPADGATEAGDAEPEPAEDSGEERAAADDAQSDEPPADAQSDAQPADAQVAEEPADAASDEAPGDAASDEPPGDEQPGDEPSVVDPDRGLLAARDETLAPIADDLSRRAKRALQDEQNDVLDGLRRQRGKIDTAKILPPAEDQLARWAHVLQPAVDAAYAAGAASVGTPDSETPATPKPAKAKAVPRALLGELSDTAVTPLRGRLESSLASVDARTPADAEIAIAQGLGARYREWRTQDLDVVLGDALAAAYARGVYDAAPPGSRLRWIAAREGKCPDCDDNALEPTVRGSNFPTGQSYPPAHPGCRCTVTVVQG